jgi:aconitate hydratase
MGAELGVTTSIFPYDRRMKTYLDATRRARIATLAEANRDLLTADPEVEAAHERFFDEVIEIDLDALEPHIVGPHSPDLARPVSRMASRATTIRTGCLGLIGSCNSSYEDIARAADVAGRWRMMTVRAPLWAHIEQIRHHRRDGQMAMLSARRDVPATGRARPVETRGDTAGGATRSSLVQLNFAARLTQINLLSAALRSWSPAWRTLSFNPLSDPIDDGKGGRFTLSPPKPAPEIPAQGFVFKAEGYVAPPDKPTGLEVKVRDDSKRLQLLQPFPGWDGGDFERLPVLLKARGKPPDHIAQAGRVASQPPRRHLRQHVPRAINAGGRSRTASTSRPVRPGRCRSWRGPTSSGGSAGSPSGTRTTARARRASTRRWSRATSPGSP